MDIEGHSLTQLDPQSSCAHPVFSNEGQSDKSEKIYSSSGKPCPQCFFFFAWHWGVQPMVGMSRLLRTCSHPDPTRIYSDSSKWTQYTLPVCSLGYGYFAEKFTFCASCPHQFNGISQDQWRSQEPCDYLCDQGLIPDDISKPLTLVDSTC